MSELLLKKRKKPQWVLKFVNELKTLIEASRQHTKSLIKTKHEIGKRILKARLNPHFYETFEEVGEFMTTVEKALKYS